MKLLRVGLLMSGITAILFAAGCEGRQAVPTPIAAVAEVTPTDTPAPTSILVPTPYRYLNVWIKPGDDFEGGTYLLSPLGLGEDENAYIKDMTVSVIILPEAGWELDSWAGPVFNEEGNTAQVKMDSSLTVVATMRRTGTK